jgi:hypothetical protein
MVPTSAHRPVIVPLTEFKTMISSLSRQYPAALGRHETAWTYNDNATNTVSQTQPCT